MECLNREYIVVGISVLFGCFRLNVTSANMLCLFASFWGVWSCFWSEKRLVGLFLRLQEARDVHVSGSRSLAIFVSSLRTTASLGLWLWFLLLPATATNTELLFLLCCVWPAIAIVFLAPVTFGRRRPLAVLVLVATVSGILVGVIVWNELLSGRSLVLAILASLLCQLTFVPGCVALVLWAPKSFSLGEAGVLVQGLLLLIFNLFSSNSLSAFSHPIRVLVAGLVMTTLWIVFSVFSFRRCHKVPVLCTLNVLLSLGVAVVWVWGRMPGGNLPKWAIAFLIDGGKTRWCLLLFWSLCLCSSVVFVGVACESRETVTTVHRKFFHLAVGLVCISGLQLDPELSFIASVIVACGFVIIEVMRVVGARPFGEVLEEWLSGFLDEQDSGPLILTPVYLLSSVFLPLWLHPVHSVSSVSLQHFAGVISVVFGDSAASVIGWYFGRLKWSNGKSVEGTMGAFLAQVAAFALLQYLLRFPSLVVWWWRLLPILEISFVLALMETFTLHIDNLVLPLLAYVLI